MPGGGRHLGRVPHEWFVSSPQRLKLQLETLSARDEPTDGWNHLNLTYLSLAAGVTWTSTGAVRRGMSGGLLFCLDLPAAYIKGSQTSYCATLGFTNEAAQEQCRSRSAFPYLVLKSPQYDLYYIVLGTSISLVIRIIEHTWLTGRVERSQ